MNDWKTVTIESIKSGTPNALSTGPFGSAISSQYFTSSGIPVIRGSNLSAEISKRLIEEDFVFVSEEKAKELERSKTKVGDIIFTCWGTINQIGIIDKSCKFSEYIILNKQMKLTPDPEKANSLFLYYLFSSPNMQNHILGNNIGSSVPGFNLGQLRSMEILIPSIERQDEIVSILSSLDDKIDLLHRQNKTLEAMAETLFRRWFVEEAEESWEETRLENHVEVLRGLSYKGSGLSEAGYGIPMHNLNSVLEGGGYKFEGIKYYNGIHKDRHVARPGDLIVANTEQGHEHRLIGFPAIVPERFGKYGIFSQHIYKLTLLPQSTLSLEFIYYALLSSEIREQVVGATNGSTVNMLAIDGLQRPKFREPTKEKVKEFTLIVNNFWKKKEVNFIQIETLEKLRDNLLPKLMAGHLAVNS